MSSQEKSQEITEFTSTAESKVPAEVRVIVEEQEGTTWADCVVDADVDEPTTPVEVPKVLSNLVKKGVKFQRVDFWGIHEDKLKLVRNHSIYFSVDTIIMSRDILKAFDKAGIDIDEITCIQRKASNKSWVLTFDSLVTEEAALEVASVEINGALVFLRNCEHRLVLVKVFEAPAELPDTAVIGRLAHYSHVLSFRRDRIAEGIDNGVRTARMELHRHIPAISNLVGEPVRIWYPSQPKTCRNCGNRDHMVKDCASVRCSNCEQPGHRADDCEQLLLCGVCKAHDHPMAECHYVLYSANVASSDKQNRDAKVAGEGKQRTKEERDKQKAEREKKKAEYQKQQQQAEKGEKRHDTHDPVEQRRDPRPWDAKLHADERPREERPRDERSRRRTNASVTEECRRMRLTTEEIGEGKRREREDDRWRDDRYHDREYSRRDYARDCSTRRDLHYSDDEDGDNRWHLMRSGSRHKRHYDD